MLGVFLSLSSAPCVEVQVLGSSETCCQPRHSQHHWSVSRIFRLVMFPFFAVSGDCGVCAISSCLPVLCLAPTTFINRPFSFTSLVRGWLAGCDRADLYVWHNITSSSFSTDKTRRGLGFQWRALVRLLEFWLVWRGIGPKVSCRILSSTSPAPHFHAGHQPRLYRSSSGQAGLTGKNPLRSPCCDPAWGTGSFKPLLCTQGPARLLSA